MEIGSKVTWTSQANGSTKTKKGVVAEIVAAGQRPSRKQYPSLYRSSGVGLPRDHASYVVQVGNKVYWPRASALQPLAKGDGPEQEGQRMSEDDVGDLASNVLCHIDTMYPEMWEGTPSSARTSIRNTVIVSGKQLLKHSRGQDGLNEALSEPLNKIEELIDVLDEARIQIEYLHGKFRETGTGNSVLARIETTLAKMATQNKP